MTRGASIIGPCAQVVGVFVAFSRQSIVVDVNSTSRLNPLYGLFFFRMGYSGVSEFRRFQTSTCPRRIYA